MGCFPVPARIYFLVSKLSCHKVDMGGYSVLPASHMGALRLGCLSGRNKGIVRPFPSLEKNSRRCLRIRSESSPNSDDSESKGLFGFVTDNESSKSAVYVQENNLGSGNVGEMIKQIEKKGRDLGRMIKSGGFVYFIRESGDLETESQDPVFVFLHGAPTQSWLYVPAMKQLADKGYKSVSFDWIGFGLSQKPQPRYYFSYTEESYHEQLSTFLDTMELSRPVFLVVQGYLLGSYGLTWAKKNPERVSHLAILNTPLTQNSQLPGSLSQLRLPFVGEFVSQNAIMTERFVEGGSPYVLEDDDADILRLPYLDTSDAGFALLEVARKFPLKEIMARIESSFSAAEWKVPTVIIWGETDKYLPREEATVFASKNEDYVSLNFLEGAGHLPQLDWPEKVVDSLVALLKRSS